MKKLILLCLIIFTMTALAAEEDAGTAAFPFLRLGVTARSLSMGEAYTADTYGAAAAVLNPAFLGTNLRHSVAFTHDEYLSDLTMEFVSYAMPLNYGAAGSVAVGMRYFSYGEMAGYDDQGLPTGSFPAADLAVTVAYGVEAFGNFYTGAGISYVYSRLDDATANAISFDLGLAWKPYDELSVGFTANHLGPDAKYVELESPQPTTLRLGLAGNLELDPRHRLTLLTDGIYPLYGKPYGALGLEYTGWDFFSLRGGYRLGHDSADFSAGAGVHFPLWKSVLLELDYAYVNYGDLETSHLFTLGLQI